MKSILFKTAMAVMAALMLSFVACSDDDDDDNNSNEDGYVVITDDGSGTGTTTWTADNEYLLDGMVFVNDGDILTIEAGTVIRGKAGQGENASALIVARGAQIIAEGTAENPIIFTAAADDLTDTSAVSLLDRGLWGGIIVLGNAELNSDPGETAIEGIPTSEPRGIYGGSDNTDNSGILKYISIRHGGTNIGEGNEINGLTLGGVGSGTEIDYIEVIANKDDGIEFFGGQPRVKHALVAYCGDDCFDYDEGFDGYGQFWCAIQDEDEGDRIGEHDGGTDPETAQPYATPEIYNATYIGRGIDAGSRMITFRDNAGGVYANSVFVNQEKGIDFELLGDDNFDRVQDSYTQVENGNLEVKNNVFYNVADGTPEGIFTLSVIKDSTFINSENEEEKTYSVAMLAYLAEEEVDFYDNDYFTTWNNSVMDMGVTAENPVPSAPATTDMAAYPGTWFESVSYKGAFDTENWAAGWTLTFK